MGLSQYDETAPLATQMTMNSGNSGTYEAMLIEEGVARRIDWAPVYSSSVSPNTISVRLASLSWNIYLGTVVIPAGAGYGAVPSVDLVAALIPSTLGAILLPANFLIEVKPDPLLGSGEELLFSFLGGYV